MKDYSIRSKITHLNVLDYGAKGDGITDDSTAINTCIAEAYTTGVGVFFPGKTFLVMSSVHVPAGAVFSDNRRMSFMFSGATFLAAASGVYTQMLDSSLIGLGLYVIFDYAWCYYSSFIGTFVIQGVLGHNHVGLGCSRLSTGFLSTIENVTIQNCKIGLYGQSASGGDAGTFVGTFFEQMQFEGCDQAISFGSNQDDMVFGTVRCTSGQGTLPQIEINGPGNCTIRSLFINGSNSGNRKGGIYVGSSGVIIDNLFLEGDHDIPVLVNSAIAMLTIGNLRVSPVFSCTNSAPIFCGNIGGYCKVTCDPQTLVAINGGVINCIIGVYNQNGSTRRFEIIAPWSYAVCAPYKVTGGYASNSDDVIFRGTDPGYWQVSYEPATGNASPGILRARLIKNLVAREVYTNINGSYFGSNQFMACRNITGVVDLGVYQIADPQVPASRVIFTTVGTLPVAGYFSISLFVGDIYSIGSRITVTADNNPCMLLASTTAKFYGNVTGILLLSGKANSLTLEFDGTYWCQVSYMGIADTSGVESVAGLAKVLGGGKNVASADYSMAGGYNAKAEMIAAFARGIGIHSLNGDAQEVHFGWYGTTYDATSYELKSNGNGGSYYAVIPSGSTWIVRIDAVGIAVATGNSCGFARHLLIKNVSGTATLVGAVTDYGSFADAALATTACTPTAYVNRLALSVTGVAATEIRWTVAARAVQVSRL